MIKIKKSKIYYDPKADILWLVLKEGEEEKHQEIAPGINIELDKKGNLLGIEILRASKSLGGVFKNNQEKARTTEKVFVNP